MPKNSKFRSPTAMREGTGFVRVRGAREHNLKNIDLDIPRDALVVFTGVSGSGKSSLAFGTLYAEAQRRYLESVSPYARRLFHQMPVPDVDDIDGLPPAVALQQQRGSPTTRSSVGSVTTLSNLLRMLYSRAGDYPRGQAILYAESFSPNTPEGACPRCHGLGRVYEVTEQSMVPDDSLTIRERAIAAWPTAWHGQNLRDIATTLGFDVDRPWRDLPKKDRDWLLFTDEQPTVPVYPGYTQQEVRRALKRKEEPAYQGTFTSAKRHVLHTFANTQSPLMKRRVAQYMVSTECPLCHGKRLRPESLSVKFAGLDIADISRLPLARLCRHLSPLCGWDGLTNGEDRGGASGKGGGRAAHRAGSCRPAQRHARSRARLSRHRTQHPDAFARRAPAAAARHAGALEPVRCGLCARRAVGRASSRGYGGAAECARAAEGVREFAVRGRAQSRRDPSRRLDRRCGSGRRRAGWLRAL